MTYYVGEFSAHDLICGFDKIAVENAMYETGLKYTNTKLVKRNGEVVAMKIWVCDIQDLKI